MLPVLERLGGVHRRDQILARAGIFEMPDGSHMIAEGIAARLHRQIRKEEPVLASALAARAGMATADYILANRIPRGAQVVLRMLPATPSAALLAKAIARHAWTFVGSGLFRVIDPLSFEITNNPLITDECADHCLCDWHAAVFERLYQQLVAPDMICREVTCHAQDHSLPCRFELSRAKAVSTLSVSNERDSTLI